MKRDLRILINLDYNPCGEKYLRKWKISAFPLIDSQLELTEEEWTEIANYLEDIQIIATNQRRKQFKN